MTAKKTNLEAIHTSDKMTLTVGGRVVYSGDMANHPNEGTITRLYVDEWGTQVVMMMDEITDEFEGRVTNVVQEARETRVTVLAFEPGPGRRFTTLEHAEEAHAAAIAKLRASLNR